MFTSSRRTRAFTLVELLVVIGIIAALIGILLPVLSGVQARGRDIKCQSNIRQIVQALFGYAAENKGSMPYGFYYGNADPVTWAGSGEFISWASQVGRYMNRAAAGVNDRASFPPVLQCPDATQAYEHPVSYIMNMIVAVDPLTELRAGAFPRAQSKPPQITLMLKETALVWDTAIRPNWQNIVGYLVAVDIDGQRFWDGAGTPQFRYYTIKDPYALIPPGVFGQNQPVQLYSAGMPVYKNIDPVATTDGGPTFPYQGNLRFRHGKEKQCNVGFADGSVRQFLARVNGDKTVANGGRAHDALRRMFMIKWPSGVPVDTTRPH